MKMRCLTGLIALVAVCGAAADTVTVCPDGSCDHQSIQDAVAAASTGDEIRIGPGIYRESIMINHDMESVILIGTAGPNRTIIDGENSRSGITGSHVHVEGLTMRNCVADQGAALSVQTTTVRNCRFEGNLATSSGGAVYANGTGPCLFEDCVFKNNRSESAGWASGGAMTLWGEWSNPITHTLRRVVFENNQSSGDGGAIWMDDPGCRIEECTFTGNVSGEYGGAVYATEMEADVTIVDCTFTDNHADSGGAILLDYARDEVMGTVENCTFTANTAKYAGCIGLAKCEARITGCRFALNSAEYQAGAIGATSVYGEAALFEVSSSLFISNQVTDKFLGAGGDVATLCPSIIESCHFHDSKGTFGASLSFEGATHFIDACTFTAGASTQFPLIRDNFPSYTLRDTSFCNITEEQALGNGFGQNDAGGNLYGTTCPDCDDDGIPDFVAIRLGLSEDVDSDGIPDDCMTPCHDINGDDIIDGGDLNILLGQWSETGTNPADLNGDQLVDGADLNMLLGAWGVCP